MRVALIHYRDSSSLGGSIRVGQLLGNVLGRTSIEPHFVFAYDGPGPVARSTKAACHFVGSEGATDVRGWVRVRRLIRHLRPDVIHFVNPVVWIAMALWCTPGTKVLHVHGPMLPGTTRLRDRWIWRAFRYLVDAHVCVSRDMENKLIRARWGRPDRTFTVYNAVDCDYWADALGKTDARLQLGLPKDKIILGMVCRLVPEKGGDDGIRLLSRLPEDYHLAIAGDGPEKQNLARLATAYSVERRVHMLGVLEDARCAYAAIDNLLFLSRTESFGLTLAEAMAAGVPVVGLSGDGGYQEVGYPLVTADNAMLIGRPQSEPVASPAIETILDHLAVRIRELNDSPVKRHAMCSLAKTWVRHRFGAQQYAENIRAVYSALIPTCGESSGEKIGTQE
jgi:glycosyltransferase involved in cell wall biosynthesis